MSLPNIPNPARVSGSNGAYTVTWDGWLYMGTFSTKEAAEAHAERVFEWQKKHRPNVIEAIAARLKIIRESIRPGDWVKPAGKPWYVVATVDDTGITTTSTIDGHAIDPLTIPWDTVISHKSQKAQP